MSNCVCCLIQCKNCLVILECLTRIFPKLTWQRLELPALKLYASSDCQTMFKTSNRQHVVVVVQHPRCIAAVSAKLNYAFQTIHTLGWMVSESSYTDIAIYSPFQNALPIFSYSVSGPKKIKMSQ